nr:lantibiotic dehydratase [uncultured Sphingobacterium sp.]
MDGNPTSKLSFEFDERLLLRKPILNPCETFPENLEFFFNESEIFREAIYLASRDLFIEINKRLINKKGLTERQLTSLTKYFIRMRSRSTPFGLFAGISITSWGKTESYSSHTIARKVRLDSSCLTQLVHYLNKLENIIQRTSYRPNNSAYSISNTLKYVNYSNRNTSYKKFSLQKIRYSKILRDIITFCGITPRKYYEIIAFLVDKEYDKADAILFINKLIEEGVILSNLQFHLTDDNDQLASITSFLKDYCDDKEVSEIRIQLEHILDLINIVESERNDLDYIQHYELIRAALNNLPFIELQKNFLQVDTFLKDTYLEKNNTEILKKEIESGLHMLYKSFYNDSSAFGAFKAKFYERYGSEPVPINEVLDPEVGLGYPSHQSVTSLSNNIERISQRRFNLSKVERFLLDKIIGNQGELREIVLQESDFTLNSENPSAPATFSVLFSIIPQGGIYLKGVHSKSASNIISRFSHLDLEVESLATNIYQHEHYVHSNKVVAEVVHYPGMERLGNVMFRKHTREYEIPYIASSQDNKIELELSDIYLWHRGNDLLLFSKKFNKIIQPYHSCAHNYNFDSLPLYKLLCDLSDQGRKFGFSWGQLSNFLSYFPRISYRNIILSPRTWILYPKDLDKTKIEAELKKRNIPSTFLICEGDNELLIDTMIASNRLILDSAIAKGTPVTIKECFFSHQDPTNEYVAIAYNKTKDNNIIHPRVNKSQQRTFHIGSEWVYFKIYLNIVNANLILINISSILKKLLNNGTIKKWFFIRYADPESHLRVRIHTESQNEVIEKLISVLARLSREGLIISYNLNVYERELERYGASNIENAEEQFYLQSLTAAEWIANGADERALYISALLSILDVLKNFNYDPEMGEIFCKINRDSLKKEIVYDKSTKIFIDKLYRTQLKMAILVPEENLSKKQLLSIRRLSSSEELLIKKIKIQLNKDGVSKDAYCSSIIHMFVNRLFIENNRTHEFILYYILTKFYSDSKYLKNGKSFFS